MMSFSRFLAGRLIEAVPVHRWKRASSLRPGEIAKIMLRYGFFNNPAF
jgi:hypothetical protein